MRVATGKVLGGQVVVDGEGELLPEGRVTLVIEEEMEGFRLDERSQQDLLEAMREIERGEFVTKEQLLAELKHQTISSNRCRSERATVE